MKIVAGRETEYAEYVKKNQDPYGKGVIDFTELWADTMEEMFAGGQDISDCWKKAEKIALQKYGITGFMYGCAVQSLAYFWPHGDLIRQMHNTDYGVTEEKAQGGCVNPAILTLGE